VIERNNCICMPNIAVRLLASHIVKQRTNINTEPETVHTHRKKVHLILIGERLVQFWCYLLGNCCKMGDFKLIEMDQIKRLKQKSATIEIN